MLPEQNRRERFTVYAETLNTRFQSGVLANMQDKPFWVLWKKETDQQGKTTYVDKTIARILEKRRNPPQRR